MRKRKLIGVIFWFLIKMLFEPSFFNIYIFFFVLLFFINWQICLVKITLTRNTKKPPFNKRM